MAKVNILLVDDRPANLLALEAILDRLGQNLVKAHSGEEALAYLEEREFAVVLLDVQMHGLDGYETAEIIRSREKTRRTPIVFVTAYEGDRRSAERAYALGAVDYLIKPLVPVILRSKVAGFIELFEKTEEIKHQAEQLRQMERREFEQKLVDEGNRRKDSERRFAWFMQQLPGLAWIKDTGGRYVYANDAAEKAFRTPRETLYGKTDDEVFPPETAAQFIQNDRQALTGGMGVQVVETLEDEGGTLRHSLVSRFPIPGPEGEGTLVGGMAFDFTDFKQAEAALRQSEEHFRTLADSIPQLAWMTRPDGHVLWYNRRWYEYTGSTLEQTVGWGWQSVVDPDELPRVMEKWTGAIAGGEPWEDTFPLRRHDGEMRWHLSRALPVRDKHGRVLGWFGTNTDITDRKHMEEELRDAKEEAEAANKAKDQFLAVLSHELRTPLNPILLAVTSMLERPSPPEDVRPNLEMIRQNVELEARLIDDLLDVMRIVTGKMPLHWQVADAHALIHQALEITRSEVLGKILHLDLVLDARNHHLNADPARLQQVLWNLIKNAVKFTPTGGTITVRTRNEEAGSGDRGESLVIEVSDTGIGIEPEVLDRIFDPFQQGETSITRRFGGLGLGLAISKGIVDGHGGLLKVASAGKERGASFTITLKALPEPSIEACRPKRDEDTPAAPHPLKSRKILLVEDEQATVRLMARLLRAQGHDVTTAGTIAAAIEEFSTDDFDLIISDIGLPDGSGLDLMGRVKSQRGTIPAIALTGYGMEEDIQRSREAGFTAHMTKPIDFSRLQAMIRQVAS